MKEHTITSIRNLLEGDARTRRLYKEWLTTGDSKTLNRALQTLQRTFRPEAQKLASAILKALNPNNQNYWALHSVNVFPGPHAYVFANLTFNSRVTRNEVFSVRLFSYLNDTKHYHIPDGYGRDHSNDVVTVGARETAARITEAAGYLQDPEA